MFNRLYHSFKDALHANLFTERSLAKRVSGMIGRSYTYLHNSTQEHMEDSHLRAEDLVVITMASGRFDALDYLEEQVGRVAFVVPKVDCDVSVIACELSNIMNEFGHLLRETGDALHTDSESGVKVSANEFRRIELECDHLQRALLRLREAARKEAKERS